MTAEFNSYRIYYYTAPQYNWDARINLYGAGGGAVGHILFMKAGHSVPASTAQGNYMALHFQTSHLDHILQILWHEKPLYVTLNPNNGIGTLSTSNEPIGEME